MWDIDSPRAKRLIAAGWLPFAAINAALMLALPGEETIPYHLIWASFAFLYGLASWSARVTWSVFASISVVTGVVLIKHASAGIIGWEECSEIVLMAVIAALLVWHVNRHQAARRTLSEIREAERVRAETRELATRFGSHELRTRLSIARAFLDMISTQTGERQTREDSAIAIAELDKASALATGLMTLMLVESQRTVSLIDIDDLIDGVAQRWRAQSDRVWVALPAVGDCVGNVERLEAALDSLIENAVKFTEPGDRITIDARFEGRDLLISVSDTGAGIPPAEVPRVTELFHTGRSAGERAGNGLGLAIVRAAAESRGGSVEVRSTLGVGTTVTMRLPDAGVDRAPGAARPVSDVRGAARGAGSVELALSGDATDVPTGSSVG